MTVPVPGEVFETPETLDRLARFLRELTDGAAGSEVYAAIVDEIDRPGHDERMDGLIDEPAVFESAWTAVTHGLRPPAEAWESVVLPAVVALSSQANVKNHLELAAALWVSAESALDTPAMVSTVDSEPALEPRRIPAARPPVPTFEAPMRSAARRRGVLALLFVLIIGAIVAVLWRFVWTPAELLSTLDHPDATLATTASRPALAPSPQASTSTGTTPPPVISQQPAPTPTWTGSGPAVAPGAPTGLHLIKATTTTIAFDWQAPADGGSGGIAYYRIFLNGQDAGWTAELKVTVGSLTPATTYSLSVATVNGAGQTSPASSPLAATTDSASSSTAPPTLSISVSPAQPIPLGTSFTVTGSGWMCADELTIWLNSALVAQRNTSPQGFFNAPINIHTDVTDSTYYANVLGGNQRVKVFAGANSLTVQCGASLSQSMSITFA